MSRRRKRKKLWRPKAPLTEDQILAWADEFHRRTGRWPKLTSGAVPGNFVDRWSTIDKALRKGSRGLPGGSSLARLLAARRGVRNMKALPRLTVPKILRWADEHHRRTGDWPHQMTRPRGIPGTNGETWQAVAQALLAGQRGLPGGSSLARVLKEHRGVRNHMDLPPLSVEQILDWADAFRERTGEWPKATDWREEIPDSGGETWGYVIHALDMGLRGFPGGDSLANLLARHRGVRHIGRLPPLSEKQILAWADAYFAAHGKWPIAQCSEQDIPGTGGEQWRNVDLALRSGLRGLSGGGSLAGLLAEHRGVRNLARLPPLTEGQILAWADAYFAAHGTWPTAECPEQVIPGTGGERWSPIDQALQIGRRSLPGGGSLAELLAEHRGVRNIGRLPPLTEGQILAWADAHFAAHGKWPTGRRRPEQVIPGTGGERWPPIDQALRKGHRGLPGGSSLADLLAKHRGVRNQRRLPPLTEQQILAWADAYFTAHGKWPTCECPEQVIPDTGGDRWRNVDQLLRKGLRGLPGDSSLTRLLAKHRDASAR